MSDERMRHLERLAAQGDPDAAAAAVRARCRPISANIPDGVRLQLRIARVDIRW